MLNSKSFISNEKHRTESMDWLNSPCGFSLNGQELDLKTIDTPLIAQFAGDDADCLVAAAKHVENSVTAIDLNLGCPQGIARRGNYGAFLLPQTCKVIDILGKMVNGLECPVTAKIRRLNSDEDTIELCKQIEDCGASLITVHGRYKEQNKQFVGEVNWDIIKRIKDAVSIPVVANGGVGSYEDAMACLRETCADGVMSAEGILEKPYLFNQHLDAASATDFVNVHFKMLSNFMDLSVLFSKQPNCGSTVNSSLKAHLFKMLYRFLSLPRNFDLRDRLGSMKSVSDAVDIVDTLTKRVWEQKNSLSKVPLYSQISWYDRHSRKELSESEINHY